VRLVGRGTDRLRRYAADPPHGIDVAGVLAWLARHADEPGVADPPRLTAAGPRPSVS
jgi:hypothetical protein